MEGTAAAASASSLLIDNGAKVTIQTSAPVSISGILNLRRATSQLNIMGDLVFTTSTTVHWDCSDGDDVRICAKIFVSGSVYLNGVVRITVDLQHPIMERKGADVAMGSLLGAVDRMGTFSAVHLDSVLKCAGATTSLSWSDFTLSGSTRCIDICRDPLVQKCPAVVPAPAVAAAAAAEKGGEVEVQEERKEREEENEKQMWSGWFVVLCIVVGGGAVFLGVMKIKRRGWNTSNNNSRRPIPLDDGEKLAELVPYRDTVREVVH